MDNFELGEITDEQLREIQRQLSECCVDPNTTFVSSHPIECIIEDMEKEIKNSEVIW